ncbi:MAG: hypothetical protein K2M17_06150, partial [Bacilli bacterium]|nr:hypothetical protein [Bacilli bacterium]
KENDYQRLRMSYILQNPMALVLDKKSTFELLLKTLSLVNPLGILEKGYSLVSFNGNLLKNSKDVKVDDEIKIKLYEGELTAMIREVKCDGKRQVSNTN